MVKNIALALVATLVACKGKEAAKNEPAPKPSAPAPAESAPPPAPTPSPTKAEPAPSAAAVDVGKGPFTLTGDAQCGGFTADGAGAYLLTRSRDNGLTYLDLVALGSAEDPKLSWAQSDGTQADDEAKVNASAAPTVAKMNEAMTGKSLAPCVAWTPKDGGKIAGKTARVQAKGNEVFVTLDGKRITKKVEEGGDASFASAFTTADGKSLLVVLSVTAEAMDKTVAVLFGPADLK